MALNAKRNTTKVRRGAYSDRQFARRRTSMQFCKDCGTVLNLFGRKRENCVLPASSIKRRCHPPAAPRDLLDRPHQKRTVLSCLPMLFYAVKTTKLSYVPKRAGSCGADHPTTKQSWRRYSPEQNEYMKFAYEGKRTSPSRQK